MKIYIGCSGWYYGHWIDRFYPVELRKYDWLAYYALHFPIVEINTTFYHLPRLASVESWYKRTPEGFGFIAKGSRYITHERHMIDTDAETDILLERLKPLGDRLKHLLWQYPPSYRLSRQSLDALEKHLIHLEEREMHNVFEFRHRSWLHNDVECILKAFGCGYVLADSPAFYDDRRIPSTCGTLYFRRHGHNGDYCTSYTDRQLEELVDVVKAREYAGNLDNVYIMYNNDACAHAVKDAARLIDCFKTAGLGSQLAVAETLKPAYIPPLQCRLF